MRVKVIKTGLLLLLVLSVLVGCGGKDAKEKVSAQSVFGYNVSAKEGADTVVTTPSYFTEDAIYERMSSMQGYYHYNVMDSRLQRLYCEILLVLQNFGEDVEISTSSDEDLSYAYQCVVYDHPELFWVDGYTYTRRTHKKEKLSFLFSGQYIYTPEEVATYKLKINNYKAHAVAGVEHKSDYEKVKHIYEYVITHTDYNMAARDNQNILSVMVYGESVCLGYARTVQYLLAYVGVSSAIVIGTDASGENHAWNLVCIDGSYYHVDATWGDASFDRNKNLGATPPSILYDYLNVTTNDILRTHTIQSVVPMPMCVALADNYYVKEGRYFTSVNTSQLVNVFADAYRKREKYVSIKASDESVYEMLKAYLIQEQQVFGLLNGKDEATYMENGGTLVLTFWL